MGLHAFSAIQPGKQLELQLHHWRFWCQSQHAAVTDSMTALHQWCQFNHVLYTRSTSLSVEWVSEYTTAYSQLISLSPPTLGVCKIGAYSSSWDESHHRATGRHLPHGITQCYLPPNKWTCPALTPASELVLDLPTLEGWKAELTSKSYPAMHQPGVELAISRSQVQRPNHYTTKPPMAKM